jgi:hypothetical protein
VGDQHHTSAALPPGKTRYPLYRRLGGRRAGLDVCEKSRPPPGFDPWTIQPIVSRYTDRATGPTYAWSMILKFNNSVSLASIHSVGKCRMRLFLAILRSFFHSCLLCMYLFILRFSTNYSSILHLSICFLVYLSALLFPNSYMIIFGNSIYPYCLCYSECYNHCINVCWLIFSSSHFSLS